MKKMLLLAVSLLSTSLFASNGIGFRSHERSAGRIDFNCKILEESGKEGRMEVVAEGVMAAGFYSKDLFKRFTSRRGGKFDISLSATTYPKDENHGLLVSFDVAKAKRGRLATVVARYAVDTEKFEVTYNSAFSGGIRKPLVLKGTCERI